MYFVYKFVLSDPILLRSYFTTRIVLYVNIYVLSFFTILPHSFYVYYYCIIVLSDRASFFVYIINVFADPNPVKKLVTH